MTIKKVILLRTRIVFLLIFLLSITIIVRLVYIQCIQGKHWEKISKIVRLEYRPIKPTRGNIYTDNHSLLATSLPFYRVAFDPCVIDQTIFQNHIDSLAYLLSCFYKDKRAQDYKKLMQNARSAQKRYVVLNRKQINYQEKKAMSQWPIFRQGFWQGGIIFEKVEKRFRPFKNLAFRTVGFVNEDAYGAGLEYSFNKNLKGRAGKALYEKTVGGHWKMVYNAATVRPVHGHDLATTLDINLQDVAHNTLLKALEENDADYGCVIVMQVQTGEVKAMANLGCIQPGKYLERYNYAVGNQGATEPGSTFKLVSMLAVLEETSLQLTDSIETGNGIYNFYDRTLRDAKRGGFGKITIQQVIEKSSNIGIAKLVDSVFKKKPEKFIHYIYQLGLNNPLGLQIIGEGVPVINHPKTTLWSGVTLPWMSIGYEVKITPLQTLTLYNALANNGKLVRPIIVKKIKQAHRDVKTFDSVVANRPICSPKTLEKLKIMLEGVVQRGTGRRIKNQFYNIAGKSGTAQKVVEGKYTNCWNTSFVGYFPAEAPQYSCIVVIDNPKGFKQYGGDMAAPVFREIADKIMAKDTGMDNYWVQENKGSPTKTFPYIKAGKKNDLLRICSALSIPHVSDVAEEWVRTTVKNDTIAWLPNDKVSVQQVPNVAGMTLKDALFLLENHGLKVTTQGIGRVSTQSLTPGIAIAQATTIMLTLR